MVGWKKSLVALGASAGLISPLYGQALQISQTTSHDDAIEQNVNAQWDLETSLGTLALEAGYSGWGELGPGIALTLERDGAGYSLAARQRGDQRLFALEYTKGPFDVVAGGGSDADGSPAYARASYDFGPIRTGLSYTDGLIPGDALGPHDLLKPAPFPKLAGILSARFDEPGLQDSTRLEGVVGASVGIEGAHDSIEARYQGGGQNLFGSSIATDFTGYGLTYAHEGTLDAFADVAMNDLGGFVLGRVFTDLGWDSPALKAAFTAYVRGTGAAPADILSQFDQIGGALRLQPLMGNVRIGPIVSYEMDQELQERIAEAGLVLERKGYEFLAGFIRHEHGRSRFLETTNGGFVGARVPMGRYVVDGLVGNDGKDTYGSLSIGIRQ